MSARDAMIRALTGPNVGLSVFQAVDVHTALHAMPDAARIALARALVPPGWVVGKVPDMDAAPEEEYGLTEFREGRRVGWNACRAAFIKSGEETT